MTRRSCACSLDRIGHLGPDPRGLAIWSLPAWSALAGHRARRGAGRPGPHGDRGPLLGARQGDAVKRLVLGADTLCWHARLEAGAVDARRVLAEAAADGRRVRAAQPAPRARARRPRARGARPAGRGRGAARCSPPATSWAARDGRLDGGGSRAGGALGRSRRDSRQPVLRVASGFYRAELAGRPDLIAAEADHVVGVLGASLDAAADAGVRLLLENHSDFTAAEYARHRRRASGADVGVFLDLINPVSSLEDPRPWSSALAPLAPRRPRQGLRRSSRLRRRRATTAAASRCAGATRAKASPTCGAARCAARRGRRRVPAQRRGARQPRRRGRPGRPPAGEHGCWEPAGANPATSSDADMVGGVSVVNGQDALRSRPACSRSRAPPTSSTRSPRAPTARRSRRSPRRSASTGPPPITCCTRSARPATSRRALSAATGSGSGSARSWPRSSATSCRAGSSRSRASSPRAPARPRTSRCASAISSSCCAACPGHHPVGVASSSIGPIDEGHARASGKLLLALAPDEAREAYLAAHPLTAAHAVHDHAQGRAPEGVRADPRRRLRDSTTRSSRKA